MSVHKHFGGGKTQVLDVVLEVASTNALVESITRGQPSRLHNRTIAEGKRQAVKPAVRSPAPIAEASDTNDDIRRISASLKILSKSIDGSPAGMWATATLEKLASAIEELANDDFAADDFAKDLTAAIAAGKRFGEALDSAEDDPEDD